MQAVQDGQDERPHRPGGHFAQTGNFPTETGKLATRNPVAGCGAGATGSVASGQANSPNPHAVRVSDRLRITDAFRFRLRAASSTELEACAVLGIFQVNM
jgi:hypothetical protein